MQAVQISSYVLGPEELRVTTLPKLKPHPDKYLIKVHACGANFFDILQVKGIYQTQPPFPWIAGVEFAGTVLATPTSPNSGIPRYNVGDAVFGTQQGAFATQVLAPEEVLIPIPLGWSFKDAAGLYVTAPTAYSALVTRANTQPGEWVLVHAGAGGVGLSAVQIAKALGATVIATAGSQRKREVCLDYGADYVIDYKDGNWQKAVIDLCARNRSGNGRQGVDIVYDPVGMIEASLKCIAWNGRLLVIGFAGGNIEKVALNRVLLKNVSIVGLHWGLYASKEIPTLSTVWKGVLDLVREGKFRGITFTDEKFNGLKSIPRALKALGGRNTWGKVVIDLDEEGGEAMRSVL